MAMTPMGVAMRDMSRPFGIVQRASSRPTGSGSAATSSMPFAIAAIRLSSSINRSSRAGVSFAKAASLMSFALAARMSAACARMASAAV
jgi:hypothetical protein